MLVITVQAPFLFLEYCVWGFKDIKELDAWLSEAALKLQFMALTDYLLGSVYIHPI